MIVEGIMWVIYGLLEFVLTFIPSIPSLPGNLQNTITDLFDLIFSNIGLLGLFVRISTLKSCLSIAISVVLFEKAYHFIMWIIRKIPFSIN